MEPYLQKKAMTTFHYALNPKGFLLLGKSETTGGVQIFLLRLKKRYYIAVKMYQADLFRWLATELNQI
jgi:two-component system CheB/CheR fusion protein